LRLGSHSTLGRLSLARTTWRRGGKPSDRESAKPFMRSGTIGDMNENPYESPEAANESRSPQAWHRGGVGKGRRPITKRELPYFWVILILTAGIVALAALLS